MTVPLPRLPDCCWDPLLLLLAWQKMHVLLAEQHQLLLLLREGRQQ